MKMGAKSEVKNETFGASFEQTDSTFDADFPNVGGGQDGKDGATFIPSVSKEGVISWTNNGNLPNPTPVNIKGEKGEKGADGEDGADGRDGVDGKTPYIRDGYWYIDGVNTNVKAKGVDGNDGYTPQKNVDYFDGKDGQDGTNGIDGKDGYTPIKGVDYFDGVNGKDGIDGKNGTNGKDGADGVSATHSWNGTTLTITSASGTSSADLKGEKGDKGEQGEQGIQGERGEKGEQGIQGEQGVQGEKGADGSNGADGVGISKIEKTSTNGKVDTYTITLANGTKSTFTVTNGNDGSNGKDGADGTDGTNGKDGTSVTVKSVSESTADGGSNVVTFSDNKTITIKNGSKGSKGDKGDKGDTGATGANGRDGADGYTPVRGVDYYTEADKAEMVLAVIDNLGGVPLFGYVDENNNVVLKGDLADGEYNIKYEMTDGSKVNIGDLVLDTNTYYTITSNLTNCTISNSATEVVEGGSYSATITANSGYELKTVSVTMGGSPVSVSGGVINISNVTGDIVITAVAEKTVVAPTNLLPLAVDANGNDYKGDNGEDGYRTGYKLSTSSGTEKANTSNPACVSGYFSINNSTDTIRIKNIAVGSVATIANIGFYKADKTYIRGIPGAAGFMGDSVSADENGVYTFSPKKWLNDTETTDIGFFRFSCAKITDETIVTVNEEIV